MFLNEPPHSHGGRRGKGAHAARESPAKRLDRANPCGGERLMRDRLVFVPLSPSHQASLKGRAQNRPGVIRSRPFPSVLGRSRKRQDGTFLMQASTATGARRATFVRANERRVPTYCCRCKSRPRTSQVRRLAGIACRRGLRPEPASPLIGFGSHVALRREANLFVAARHVVVRVGLHPRMIGRSILRREIQHQLDVVLGEPLANCPAPRRSPISWLTA